MLEEKEGKESNAEIRDDYSQSSLDQHIASDAGRDRLALVDKANCPLASQSLDSILSFFRLSIAFAR